MATTPNRSSAEELWQSQIEEISPMTLDAVRLRAQSFQQSVHRRNLREYAAGVVAAVILGVGMWLLPHTVARLGAFVTLLGLCYVVVDLRRTGAARGVPGQASTEQCLAFHRRELGRQRDVLHRAGTTYIAALLPGVLLVFVGTWLQVGRWLEVRPEPMVLWLMGIAWTAALAVLAIISWGNLREARQLQRELDALGE